jgi:hypothetical protein
MKSKNHYILPFACLLTLLASASTADAQRALHANAPTRARIGLEAGLGAALGDTKGGAFLLGGQLGVQANDLFAIYWKPNLVVDGWATDIDDQLDVFVFGSQLAMLDFTLGRVFQIGVGGGVDIGKFGVCSDTGRDAECDMRTKEVRPAAEGRVALIIPLPGIRARWGIPITFTAHTTFFSGRQIHTLVAGPGLLRF